MWARTMANRAWRLSLLLCVWHPACFSPTDPGAGPETGPGGGDGDGDGDDGGGGKGTGGGSGDGDGDGDGDAPDPALVSEIDAFVDAISETICDLVAGCQPVEFLQLGYGPGGCVGRVLPQLQDSAVPLLADSIAAGRIVYDPDARADCLDAFRQSGCTTDRTRQFDIGACAELFVGTAAIGEPCQLHDECIGKAYCAVDGACPGTCAELGERGAPCAAYDECADGLVCGPARTCQPLGDVGEACGGANAIACGLDAVCSASDTEAGTCLAIAERFTGELGDTCDLPSYTMCRPGLSCAVTLDGTTNSATWACETKVASGMPCKVAAPDMCPIGQYCDANADSGLVGTCQTQRVRGEACDEAIPCRPDLLCVDGACQRPARLDDACTANGDCASGSCGAQGTCVRPTPCNL